MNSKKILASVLCINVFTLYTPLGVMASEISGVTPNGNVYNIEASKVSGSTGFRHYDKFNLSQGDMANLIYKNYDKFVNLVNSQIGINGILNTINANGGFFNGHAIFVSPLGMVIGSSGVLNVGSLSVLTPSQNSYNEFLNSYKSGNLEDYQYNADKYKGLITDSQGDIFINGKILARNEVNIFGKNINIGDSNIGNSGIVAGWQDSNTVINEQKLAENTFNALVSNPYTNANSIALKDGKIILAATSNQDLSVDDVSTASVNIKNSNLVSNDIDISANTTMNQIYFKEGVSKVNIENSKIVGDNVSIVANAVANTSKNINLMPPAIWAWFMENEGNISEYFSSNIYNGFSGTRTSSNVTVKNSIIEATNDINILSKAESSLAVDSDIVSQGAVPQLFYALGTRTNSKINIDNSTLNAKNDINLNALSKNEINVKMIDNSDYIFKIKTQDAYHATILKSSTIADTAINIINGSKITANNFNAKSLAYGNGEYNLINSATVGKNDFASSSKGGSGAAFIYFMNDSDTSSAVNIKDSTIETTGDSEISATNLNSNGTWATISTSSKGYVKSEGIQEGDGFFKKLLGYINKYYDKYTSVTTVDMTQLFKNVFGKAQENIAGQVNQNVELGMANFQAGGGVVVNNSKGSATVNIENSNIVAKDLNIESYNLDQSYNNSSVSASATEGGDKESAIVGAGIAVVINNHKNTSNVLIKNSTLNADNVSVNAINDLPGNHGHLGISNKYFKLGFDFNADSDDVWEFKPVASTEGESINLVPEFGLFGFFNNFASAASSGDKAAISASIVYNTTSNNADVIIENSIVNATNNFASNAVNSVVARDAVGFLNSDTILNIGSIFEIFNSNGLGGNVIVQDITNNANAKIIGSNINVSNGDLTLASANRQSYLNIATIGGQSEKMTINGAVNVQNINGETNAIITGNSNVSANNVNVNAGKAKVALSKEGASLNDDDELEKADEKEVNDKVSNLVINGVLSDQKSSEAVSASAAFGAAVNTQNINRTINSEIENSTVNAKNDVNVTSNSTTKSVVLAMGASFAGGKSMGNGGAEAGQGANIGVGNADEIIDDAVSEAGSMDVNVGDVEDVANINEQGDNALDAVREGVNATSNQLSIAAVGSVNVLTDNTNTKSNITNSTVNVGNDLNVTADNDNFAVMGAGGIAKSGKIGGGAGVNVYTDKGSSKALIDGNSTINFTQNEGNLTLKANNTNTIYNIAAGVGIASDSSAEGVSGALGGSFAINTIKPTIEAMITDSTVNGNSKTNVSLNSLGKVDIVDTTGGLSANNTKGLAIGASIASSVNLIKGNISSQVSNSTLNDINDLTIIADSQNDLFTLDVAAALASSNTTSSFNFDGAVGVDYFENTINAKILSSTVEANGDVDVEALSSIANTNSAGVAQYSGAQNAGLGVNGNVIVNIHKNVLNTTVDRHSKIKAKNLNLLSKSIEKSILTPVGFAISGRSTSMVAANVNYNLNKNDISSVLSGDINVENDVNVLAFDESTLYSRGGTLAFVNSGQGVTGAVSGAVNIDKFKKNVVAKIEDANLNASNDVVVNAQSINSIGGTKKDDGSYELPDITSSNYKDLVKSDGTGYNSSFENWNMFYSLSAGGRLSGGGTVIIKSIENTVSASVSNSTIKSNSLTAVADEYSIKNIVVGMAQAFGDAAVGASVLIDRNNSSISSVIDNGSEIEVADDVNVIARNKKDNHFVTAMLGYGTKGAGGANVVSSDTNDKTYAKIEGSAQKRTTVEANELNVKATTDINSTNISFIGSGSSNLTFNIEPTINNYKNETSAYINYGDIKNAKININAYDKTDSLNVLASISGAGEGFAGSGLILKNNNRNSLKGYINNSIIDTDKDISIDTNSVIDYSNWVVSGGFTGTGATLLVNFIINNVVSDLQAGIKNSEIKNSGNITILANKDVKDNLNNVAGSASITGQGLTAETNLIYNLYNNKITTYFDNVDTNKISSLNLEAYANRDINNKNYGISTTAEGVSLLVDAIVNEVDSTVYSYVDAKDNTIVSAGDINVIASDLTTLDNQMAFVSIVGLGATIGANVNLVNANNTVKSEILSATGGSINARNINLDSKNILALKSTDVAVTGGFGAASIDVLKITLGKRTGDFNELEENNGTKQVVEDTLTKYAEVTKDDEVNGLYTSSSTNAETGSISRISGNVKTSNDISVKAFSKLKGKDSETLKITNVPVSAGVVAVGVGVQSVEIANNTFAEISNANVTSTNGNVEVNAETKNDVSIVNTDVNIAGVAISGASGTYKNTSETISKIADSNVSANNVNVISKLSNKADIWDTAVIVSGASVGVAVSDATDMSKTIAMITGDTNIDAKGDLNIHSTANSDMSAVLRLTSVSVAKLCSYIKNNASSNTLTEAIMKNVDGTINVGNLNIIADLGTMSVLSRANIVSVSGLSYADIGKSGAYLNSTTTAGIDSKNSNLVINNQGTTNIKSGVKASDNNVAADLTATAKIIKTGVSMGANIYASSSATAENNATVNAYLNANEHNANNLNLVAKSNAIANAVVEAVEYGTVLNVSSATLNSVLNNNLNVTINGKNSIKQIANIVASNTSENNTSMDFSPVGLAINVGTGTLISKINSNTSVTLGGDYNSASTNVDVNTTRHSKLDLTSSSGSLISVANSSATNIVSGKSELNIDGFVSNSDSDNRLSIKSTTNNILDTMSVNKSGGFIAVSNVNPTTSLNTSNNLNLKNSNINSEKDVKLSVENKNTVIDSASLKNGGFVAVAKTGVSNTYTTSANLNIENSTINAKNVDLSAKASTVSGTDMLNYVGKGGGFVASTTFNVDNTLNQTSNISLKNSKVRAKENLNVNVLTSSYFRQKTSTSAGGFTAAPKNSNTLTVNNTNRLSLDSNSLLKGEKNVLVNFDSNDTLYAYSDAYASHFGFSSPSSNSVIKLTINNTLDNSGSIQGGESVEINTMKNSYSDLYQYAYSEANAAIPTTNESGSLTKIVNNAINISNNANITSGGDINIRYSSGRESLFSKIAYTSVCRALFGIPITSRGSKSNITTNTNNNMTLNGEVVAGSGNSKYMKINRDGSVDFSTTTFNDDEYILVDNRKVTEEELRQKDRISLVADLEEINVKIESVDSEINDTNDKIAEVDSKIKENENTLNELNKYKDNIKTEDDINSIIENNIKEKIVGTSSEQLNEEQYENVTNSYKQKCTEIENSNLEKMENGQSDLAEIPTFVDYVNEQKESLGITNEQLNTITDVCEKENSKFTNKVIAGSEYVIFDDTILVLRENENPITDIEKVNEALKNTKEEYENLASGYINEKTLMTKEKDVIQNNLDNLENKKYDIQDKDYSIVFSEIRNKASEINISGMNASNISGNGKFRVASSGMKIDNYSNRSLLFSDIDMATSFNSGLYINNLNFGEFLNKSQALNNTQAMMYLKYSMGNLSNITTNGVHYISGYSSGEQSGITINNYYDNSNPFAPSKIASDIAFGLVKSNGIFDVWNESGSIMLLGDVNADNVSLIASKGSVISINESDFRINNSSDNFIYGGNGIYIFTSNNIDLSNIKMETRPASRTITITDDMLNNLIEDPTTGEKNMIDLGYTRKSSYLNSNNNIKAIYKDGQIYLFDIEQANGEISLNTGGTVNFNPNGFYKTSEGYQTISIDNQTSKVLNVGAISNAKFNGGLSQNSNKLANVGQNTKVEKGDISITSKGKINVNDNILSNIINNTDQDNSFSQDNQDGVLSIISENGVFVKSNTEIRNSGDLIINSQNDDMNILGKIYNNGDLTISKDGVGNAVISSIIENTNGNLNIIKNGTGNLEISSVVENFGGNLKITKQGSGNVFISSILENTAGDLYISSEGNGDLSIADKANVSLNRNSVKSSGNLTILNKSDGNLIIGSEINNYGIGNIDISAEESSSALNIINKVKANTGNIKLSGNNGLSVESTVETQKGDIIVNNTNGGITISSTGSINTKDGNIALTNNGNDGINLDGIINAEKQDVTIDNTNGGIAISSTGSINTKDGNITLTNNGNDGINLDGTINAEKQDVTINNTNGGITISTTGSINTKDGNITLTNNGNDGINLDGIINAEKQDVTINNTNGGIAISSTGSINTKDGNINLTNKGQGGISVDGTINTDNNNIDITNELGEINVTGLINANNGNIDFSNTGENILLSGKINSELGDISLINKNGSINIAETGSIKTQDGNIALTNNGNDGINLDGIINAEKQDVTINNTNGGITISSTGLINTKDGDIKLTNKGQGGINIKGIIKSDNKNILLNNENSNIVIGEYESDNDNYIQTLNGDITITQKNGSILNGVIDAVLGNNHSSHDLNNPNKAYKTLISSNGNLTLNVTDGNIGESDFPAFSVDAKTRDYTDSINVNVEKAIVAKAVNKNSNEKRLVNLRAKNSDLNIKNIQADGDVILTAIDWKQGDLRPTPSSDDYYKGYSILNYADDNQPNIIGQNISIIASDNIGSSSKNIVYLQDTMNAPNSSISIEAENNIYMSSKVNSSNPTKIYQLISKRGDVNMAFDADTEIGSITAGKNLHLLSTAKNLTIYEIGNLESRMMDFEDVLYPHDNILAKAQENCIPESIDIEVLDINGGDSANSTLKIYSAFVKGRNNGQGAYYEDDGTRMDDVFLMADNIYANSSFASDSVNSEREYSEGVFGGDSSKMIKAKGINAYGDGAILSIDVRGVNKDLVEALYPSSSRTNYKEQLQVQSPFSKFLNKYALIDDINYVDNRANNIVLSVNDYMGSNRNVQINTIIADNAYVNTASDVLNINEGYIEHFGEFKNSTKLAIIDNDNRKIYDNADIQLYTAKTGSFNLFMNKSIDINTTAGTVNRKPNILVNGYHSAWTFVDRAEKETKNSNDRLDMNQAKNKNADAILNTKTNGIKVEPYEISSDKQILNISFQGATVKDNGTMKVGKYSTLKFNIDNEEIIVKVKVESLDNGFVKVRFVDVPDEIISKILYQKMLKAEK